MKKFKIVGQGKKKYSTRKIKRTWYSKKKGTYITKVYEYEGYKTTTRSSKLIVKNGKLTKYGEQYVKELKKNINPGFRVKVDEYVFNADDLKESTLISKLEGAIYEAEHKEELIDNPSKHNIRQFIYNMGGDVDDLAQDLGISKDDLLNEANWRFVSPEEAYFTFNGNEYEFYFKYKDNLISWQIRK